MPKIEVPTSVTLYVQWIHHPFPNPQIPEHKSTNSKWALDKAKKLLEENSIDKSDVKVVVQYNGKILIEIREPRIQMEEGKEMWEYVFSFLKKSNEIISISIFVNNDISEMIAMNYADRVPRPWHTGYKGSNTETLIYHKQLK